MSQYAWSNPTNGVREQDDSLKNAVTRIQEELQSPEGRDFQGVMLYRQEPCVRVEPTGAYKIVAPRWKQRFMARVRLMFQRRPEAMDE